MKEYICREVSTENGGYLEIETELIRCRDCKNYYPNMEASGETGDCKKARWFRRLQYPNDYCSRAERKSPQVNPEMVKALVDRIEKQRGEDAKRKS